MYKRQELTELDSETAYAEVLMEKPQWKAYVKEQVKRILKYRPEAVYVLSLIHI